MPSIDWPLDRMREYKPDLYRETDFDSFWDSTISESLHQPLNAQFIPYELPAKDVECYQVRYDGFRGGTIAGWYLRPAAKGKYPALMQYHGYSGRAQRPLDVLSLVHQGICVMTMDTRGQNGLSEDAAPATGGHHSGWMTKGIRDPKTYYYRYVYADAVRALELLATQPEVDAERLALTGISQGGGITLAVAALAKRPISLAMSDIPFMCDYRRAIEITPLAPYTELSSFLKSFPADRDQVIRTLSYCDNINLAPRIRCRTLVCNCLWDDICPPSTIFAAYNHIPSPKRIEIYPYHKHEVPYEHAETRFRELVEVLKP